MFEEQTPQVTTPVESQPAYTPAPGSPESATPSSGYLRSETDIKRDTPVVAPDPGYDINELATKLGVDPASIGQPEVVEQVAPPPVNTEDWYAKQFGTDEAKQFADNFKKYIGIDIKEVYQLINNTAQVNTGLETWRKQVTVQQQTQQLKQEFGAEFDTLMPLIGQRFKQIQATNPKQAAALDNLDGARMLAALIRQEGIQQNSVQQPDVPQYLPNRRPLNRGGQGQSPVIKMSDFVKWSDEEVQARYGEIVRAKQNGTFINDF
jgi:hypothetical protein